MWSFNCVHVQVCQWQVVGDTHAGYIQMQYFSYWSVALPSLRHRLPFVSITWISLFPTWIISCPLLVFLKFLPESVYLHLSLSPSLYFVMFKPSANPFPSTHITNFLVPLLVPLFTPSKNSIHKDIQICPPPDTQTHGKEGHIQQSRAICTFKFNFYQKLFSAVMLSVKLDKQTSVWPILKRSPFSTASLFVHRDKNCRMLCGFCVSLALTMGSASKVCSNGNNLSSDLVYRCKQWSVVSTDTL